MVCGPYVWPPISINSPYYSMALMANAANYAYAPVNAYSSPASDIPPASPGLSQLPLASPLVASLDGSGPAGVTTQIAGQAAGGVSPGSLGTSGQSQDGSAQQASVTADSQAENGSLAVLQTSSTTVQKQGSLSGQSAAAPSAAAVIAPSSAAEDVDPIPESHKIFPSDYLFSHQRTASGRLRKDSTETSISAGIGNFPKQTTVMMLRTLELQETI